MSTSITLSLFCLFWCIALVNVGFQIYIAGNEWESQETIKLDINSPTEHTVNSLRCGCKYQIYFVAFNEAGNSDPSEVQTFQTLGNGSKQT